MAGISSRCIFVSFRRGLVVFEDLAQPGLERIPKSA